MHFNTYSYQFAAQLVRPLVFPIDQQSSVDQKNKTRSQCRPPPAQVEPVEIVPVRPPATVRCPDQRGQLAAQALPALATRNRNRRRIQRSAKRWAHRPSGSRRNWPRSRSIRRRIVAPGRRATICTNGCRRFWGHPVRCTKEASSSWTFTFRPSIRLSRPRLVWWE